MLAKSNLNSIENRESQALIDLEISHEEYKSNINEKENYRRLNENIRMTKSSDELNEKKDARIENNKNIKENYENTQNLGNFLLTCTKTNLTTKDTCRNNGIEVIVDINATLWLNEKHIEGKLDHKKL